MGQAKQRGTRDGQVVQSKQQLLQQLRSLDERLCKSDARQFEALLPTRRQLWNSYLFNTSDPGQ